MRYLSESEISSYLNAGKEIEQFIEEFHSDSFKCFRYIVLGKNKSKFTAILFEKFDDSDEGLESIYDYSSVEPDNLYGKEIGNFDNLEKLIIFIKKAYALKTDKYLISGQLDDETKTKPNNSDCCTTLK